MFGERGDTCPREDRPGHISIRGLLDEAAVKPTSVVTQRPDVFRPGYFSVFDALLSACRANQLDLRYHFDPDLQTHVIDSLGGEKHWWYAAGYHGGHRQGEEPVHRMDCHPYKDWMTIRVYPVAPARLEAIHAAFRAEVQRRENDGKVVVPTVTVALPDRPALRFEDVEVSPHGLRDDMFQEDVLTVADVMLSLADQGRLTLDVEWLEELGDTLVQSYYFTRFDGVRARGRAGFTYGSGEEVFRNVRPTWGFFGNNRFHMTADIRVVLCPQYVRWRWTDLSRRRPGAHTGKGRSKTNQDD